MNAKRSGNLNCLQEAAYGHNRWKDSALRQYLNSSQLKGYWWKPADEFDIAPDYLATHDGFLVGFDQDLLSRLIPAKTVTYPNTVIDDTGSEATADITYDRIFIPSIGQMYCQQQIDEGDAWEYYKRLIGGASPATRYTYEGKPIIKYALNSHKSPQNVFSRSALRGNAGFVWNVNAGGDVDYWSAIAGLRAVPACRIG